MKKMRHIKLVPKGLEVARQGQNSNWGGVTQFWVLATVKGKKRNSDQGHTEWVWSPGSVLKKETLEPLLRWEGVRDVRI